MVANTIVTFYQRNCGNSKTNVMMKACSSNLIEYAEHGIIILICPR